VIQPLAETQTCQYKIDQQEKPDFVSLEPGSEVAFMPIFGSGITAHAFMQETK
jgi:hypothetical protein